VNARQRLQLLLACSALICAPARAQPATDIAALEAAGKRGDATALITLAEKYKRGDDVTRDVHRSNELYCKAAGRGSVDALLELGLIYASGREMIANEGVGALLINMAAERGSERAKEILPYISRGVGSFVPPCLTAEMAAAAATNSLPVSGVRKDIEMLVQQLAPQYSIDPDLVMALIGVESRFNTTAVSPKNAQGLMQLIPATAVRFGVKNTFNAADNLKGGLSYLRWLLAYFQGDVMSLWCWPRITPAKKPSSGIAAFRRMRKRAITSGRSRQCTRSRSIPTSRKSPSHRP
jgi:hypothetical protein